MTRLLFVLTLSVFISNISYAICGQDGTVAERIQDCATEEGAILGNLTLVSRDHDQNDIYQDQLTKLLWGAPLASKVNYAEAKDLCANFKGIGKKGWKLPSVSDFSTRGVYSNLPKMKDFYWTSTPLPSGGSEPQPDAEVKYQMMVNGHYQDVTMMLLRTYKGVAVRCVLLHGLN